VGMSKKMSRTGIPTKIHRHSAAAEADTKWERNGILAQTKTHQNKVEQSETH